MIFNREKRYRPNLNEIAYEEIKNMILTGQLVQGERIILSKMAEQMNLSITPVREALNKLAQEDLIQMTPRTSYEVVRLNKDDISDILDIRELLETFALRSAGDNLKSFPVEELSTLFRKPYSLENYMQFIEADIRLHETIISVAKNRKLKKLFDFIYNGIRILAVPSAKIRGRMEKSNREHLDLLKAIGEGNIEKAVDHLSHHIRQVKTLLLKHYDEN
jgi:GntR family transcriptional regulator, rspAB operon transcriptional repressor